MASFNPEERIKELERSVKSLSESLNGAVDAELKALKYAWTLEKRVQELYEQQQLLEKENKKLTAYLRVVCPCPSCRAGGTSCTAGWAF
jgi:hypothetical protein